MKLHRSLALRVTCAFAASLLAACGSNDSSGASGAGISGDKLVFVNFGSDGLTAAKAAWLDPYSAKSGVQFATDSPSDPAKVKAMVDAGNTTWDVIDLDVGSGMRRRGHLERRRPTPPGRSWREALPRG